MRLKRVSSYHPLVTLLRVKSGHQRLGMPPDKPHHQSLAGRWVPHPPGYDLSTLVRHDRNTDRFGHEHDSIRIEKRFSILCLRQHFYGISHKGQIPAPRQQPPMRSASRRHQPDVFVQAYFRVLIVLAQRHSDPGGASPCVARPDADGRSPVPDATLLERLAFNPVPIRSVRHHGLSRQYDKFLSPECHLGHTGYSRHDLRNLSRNGRAQVRWSNVLNPVRLLTEVRESDLLQYLRRGQRVLIRPERAPCQRHGPVHTPQYRGGEYPHGSLRIGRWWRITIAKILAHRRAHVVRYPVCPRNRHAPTDPELIMPHLSKFAHHRTRRTARRVLAIAARRIRHVPIRVVGADSTRSAHNLGALTSSRRKVLVLQHHIVTSSCCCCHATPNEENPTYFTDSARFHGSPP